MELEQKLKKVFSETFNVSSEKIFSETKQSDLKDWDSLGQLRLFMEIESAFDTSFLIEEIKELNSFQKILERLRHVTRGT